MQPRLHFALWLTIISVSSASVEATPASIFSWDELVQKWTDGESLFKLENDITVPMIIVKPPVIIDFEKYGIIISSGTFTLDGSKQDGSRFIFQGDEYKSDSNSLYHISQSFYVEHRATLTLENCDFQSLLTTTDPRDKETKVIKGTAINSNGGNITLKNCSFTNNKIRGQQSGNYYFYGGAISHEATGGILLVESGHFGNNSLFANSFYSPAGYQSSAYGGAISATNIILRDSTFTRNMAYASSLDADAFARGGALYGGNMTLERCAFTQNLAYADYGDNLDNAYGGAIYSEGTFLNLTECTFANNAAFASSQGPSNSYGGAIYGSSGTLTLTDCSFINNKACNAAFANIHKNPSEAFGGAICWDGMNAKDLIIKDCSFYENYSGNSGGRKAKGGALYYNGRGMIALIADKNDIIFRGNKDDLDIKKGDKLIGSSYPAYDLIPILDTGRSNAVYVAKGGVNLHANSQSSVIFYDSVDSMSISNPFNINPDNDQGYASNGIVEFKNENTSDTTTIENFTVNLYRGTLKMGDNTAIKGIVNATTESTLHIAGFTSIGSSKGDSDGVITAGQYNVAEGREGEHLIYVQMNTAMSEATENNPVWNFGGSLENGDRASLKATPGTLKFILDISDISPRPEELHPFIFSHEGQTEELMESVRNSASVSLIDADGWQLEILKEYIANGITYDYFDYLSGQYGVHVPGVTPPVDPPVDPELPIDPIEPIDPPVNPAPEPIWKAPTGVGSVQADTLWTTTRGLWAFSDHVRQQSRQRLQWDKSTFFWASGLGDYFTQENNASGIGYRYSSFGYAVGGEHIFASGWSLGAALGQTYGNHDVNDALGRIDKDALSGLLYSSRTIKLNKVNTLIIDLQAGVSYTSHEGGIRNESLNNEILSGKWNDTAYLVDMQALWNHQLKENVAWENYAGLQYTHASQNDYTIQGSKYAYQLSDGSMYDFRAVLGTGIRRNGHIGEHKATAYMRAGIIQDISREIPTTNVQGKTHNWSVKGSKPGWMAGNISAGINIQIVKEWSAGLQYSFEAGEAYQMQSGRLTCTYEF